MKNYLALATALAALTLVAPSDADAHCEVPCGIFSDDTVLKDLYTDHATIAKAMSQINVLSKDPAKNANQITRWVTNKEKHAEKIQHTMMQYFLAQRIKLAEMETNKEAYLNKLTLAHKVIVQAMKSKQTTDPAASKALYDSILAFTKAYTQK